MKTTNKIKTKAHKADSKAIKKASKAMRDLRKAGRGSVYAKMWASEA